MKPTCVVHLTRCEGSVQASARLARFLADTLHLPLVDGLGSLAQFVSGETAYLRNHDSFNVIMVNGPVAFCDMRDQLGELLLKHTARLLWVQQDWTITLPPHQSYSRPTKAETPFRQWFHSIPEVACWTTCMDTLDRRHSSNTPGWPLDQYINFNALTYAPFGMDPDGDPPTQPGVLLYYGALREGRSANLKRLLDDPELAVDISVSRSTQPILEKWRAVVPHAGYYEPKTGDGAWVCTPHKPANGNRWGVQPLLGNIAEYGHSLYVADNESNIEFHSLANRFYEVLSTPSTLLWLDSDGGTTYNAVGLADWATYAVQDADELAHKMGMANQGRGARSRRALAERQRLNWLARDPFTEMRRVVKKAFTKWQKGL